MNPAHRINASFNRGALILGLLTLFALPSATSAACTGEHADMQSYAGNYVSDRNLLAAPLVAARLQRLPAQVRAHLNHNLDVAGPIDLISCHLVLTGNAPHMGGEENAIVAVNLHSGAVSAAIHSGGRTDIYVINDPAAGAHGATYDDVPKVVKDWAVLADMGFPYQQPRTAHVHTTPR